MSGNGKSSLILPASQVKSEGPFCPHLSVVMIVQTQGPAGPVTEANLVGMPCIHEKCVMWRKVDEETNKAGERVAVFDCSHANGFPG